MKTRITQSEIEYIQSRVERFGNVSIYLSPLSLSVIEKLRKKFKVTKEYFGYYKFEKISENNEQK